MLNKTLGFVCLFFAIIIFFCLLKTPESKTLPKYELSHVERMPLVQDPIFSVLGNGGAPNEQRGSEFVAWLSNGLKISVPGASGSGTIVYYDENTKIAYVQSCGHLWNGSMTAEQGSVRKVKCQVHTWYHNNQKLNKFQTYDAEVLYYSNGNGQDVSLLRFRPDWVPRYLPIAAADYVIPTGTRLHSVGCDGGREVAHYDVKYLGDRGQDLVTTDNSPRPGRSGGGLSTNEYFVGVCWGTSDYSGTGTGYFTPLRVVRNFNEKNGFGWINDAGRSLARMIPIIDKNNPQGKYPKDYLPLPR